jgi:crotonobetainyl-CoA:carnitine CoA-transferase CaiB-like acyl-CoA transferase
MTQLSLPASCLPDLGAEHAHLAGLLAGLTDLPDPAGTAAGPRPGCAVLAWARSGLMHLTGPAGSAPLAPRAPVLPRAELIASAIAGLTADRGQPVRIDTAHLLADRAALHGWQRRGSISANGTCRILRAADGWVAVNLSRPGDVAGVAAVIGQYVRASPWEDLARNAAHRPAADLAVAAQLVGIPAAVLGSAPAHPLQLSHLGPPGAAPPLVLDLSAMWAGPLCASILHQAGWRVLKVEDSRRPDGARSGSAAFYRSLHDGIPAVQLDFGTSSGRAELARLAARAGIVIESSRPRALQRLGLEAAGWLGAADGRVWVSVTGYGRGDPSQRVAFGDDAAVAGGLVARTTDDVPVFCGDAIADPLTGMLAALAVVAASAAGGGWLVDVAMAGVCADLMRAPCRPEHPHLISQDRGGWLVRHGELVEAVRSW